MNRLFYLTSLISITTTLFGQNVGINNPTPAFPLSFSNAWGTKISLWGDANYHYGIAAQPTMMQFFTDISSANIGFGYGTTSTFNERMRIINSGFDGMQLNGRLVLSNGSSPLNLAAGPGVWLSRPDNSSLGGFMGVQNNTNIGFYGTNAGWGLVYNVDNGRVGLGTSTPANRLDIAGLNNWDLTNTEGDVRIGNDNHRLKFGVALQGGGSGAASIMQSGGVGLLTLGANNKNLLQLNGGNNSLNLISLTGGLRVDGNAGTAGQQLESRGNAATPVWKSKPYLQSFSSSGETLLITTNSATVPGLDNQLLVLQEPCRVQFTIAADVRSIAWTGTCSASFDVEIRNSANNAFVFKLVANGYAANDAFTSLYNSYIIDLPAGAFLLRASHVRPATGTPGESRMVSHRAMFQLFPL